MSRPYSVAHPARPPPHAIVRAPLDAGGPVFRVLRLEDGKVRQGGAELCQPGARLLVDLTPEPEHLEVLRERFGFHPLALEDCAHEDQRNKIDEYPEALFVVVHRIAPAPLDDGYDAKELDLFLTDEALVAVHAAPVPELDALFARCAADATALGRGPDFLLYLVLDAVTDAHFAVADHLTDEVEELASEVVADEGRQQELLARLLHVRRMHAQLRRYLAPQREVVAALSRPGAPRIAAATGPYLRDVHDHLVRVTEEIDVGRDVLGSVMDVHLNLVNNRLNAVMTRLTLVSTIFLPLNFVVGWFGMNLPILPVGPSKALAVAITLVLPPAMWWWFRRKRLL
jgi:magnesium transporter